MEKYGFGERVKGRGLVSLIANKAYKLNHKNCAVIYSAVLIVHALYYIPPSKSWPFLYLFSMHDLRSITAWLQYYEGLYHRQNEVKDISFSRSVLLLEGTKLLHNLHIARTTMYIKIKCTFVIH